MEEVGAGQRQGKWLQGSRQTEDVGGCEASVRSQETRDWPAEQSEWEQRPHSQVGVPSQLYGHFPPRHPSHLSYDVSKFLAFGSRATSLK